MNFDLPFSFSFVWLCLYVCLSLFHLTALQHSEPLALVCTASDTYMENEDGWHAKHSVAMWEASGISIEYMRCCQAGFDTVISWQRRCKFVILRLLPLYVCLFSILLHYSHSKGPYSKMHPIWAGVTTFILAEFNYGFPVLPFFLALIHPKPCNPFYNFS